MSPDKLVYMANQIATFFASQPRQDQAESVARHLRDYWDPRMRDELLRLAAAGDAGLNPVAAAAVERMRADAR
jgi:formate dehydrogenase subunit delta